MYDTVKGDVARIKQLRRLTYADIGRLTGYRENTIAQFMCGKKESPAVAEALAKMIRTLESETNNYERETE